MTVLLRAYGFETRPLREYCTAEEIADACSDPDVAVLCLSFQTTYDLPDLKIITGLLAGRGIRDRIVLSAGGTAVSERIASEAGCDVFRMTALETAEAVEKEVRKRKSASSAAIQEKLRSRGRRNYFYLQRLRRCVRRWRTADGRSLDRLRKFPPPRARWTGAIRYGESRGKGSETTQIR